MKGRTIYGPSEDNFLVEHGVSAPHYGSVPAVQVEIGTEKVGVPHTFTDGDFLIRLGEAMIRAGQALLARQSAVRHTDTSL